VKNTIMQTVHRTNTHSLFFSSAVFAFKNNVIILSTNKLVKMQWLQAATAKYNFHNGNKLMNLNVS